jgi:hypothetical protein
VKRRQGRRGNEENEGDEQEVARNRNQSWRHASS